MRDAVSVNSGRLFLFNPRLDTTNMPWHHTPVIEITIYKFFIDFC